LGSTQARRDRDRDERERRDRDRERERDRDREGEEAWAQLAEEQREEVNEAVSCGFQSLYFCLCLMWEMKRGREMRREFGLLLTHSLIPILHIHKSFTKHSNSLTPSQFGLFDLDKDQHIDYHELKVALRALGFDMPKAELVNILNTHGVPSTSTQSKATSGPSAGAAPSQTHPSRLLLSLSSFQALLAQKILARDPREEILRAFELFDAGGKGRIELADLRRVARELGEGLGEDELVAMIEEFDLDGDGGIDREEFLGICLG
jgi:centrin-3